MDWTQFGSTLAVLGVFSVFIMSIIEVIKGISATGLKGLIVGLWDTLISNKKMPPNTFPVLNFVIALLYCWSFRVGVMIAFTRVLNVQPNNALPQIAYFLDYFGTASVVYLGADQMFKKFVDAAVQEGKAITTIKQNVSSVTATISKDNIPNAV